MTLTNPGTSIVPKQSRDIDLVPPLPVLRSGSRVEVWLQVTLHLLILTFQVTVTCTASHQFRRQSVSETVTTWYDQRHCTRIRAGCLPRNHLILLLHCSHCHFRFFTSAYSLSISLSFKLTKTSLTSQIFPVIEQFLRIIKQVLWHCFCILVKPTILSKKRILLLSTQ